MNKLALAALLRRARRRLRRRRARASITLGLDEDCHRDHDPLFARLARPFGADIYQGARQIVDHVDRVDATVDGKALPDMMSHRVTSDALFDVDGSTTLRRPFDGCITGAPQPAVADAYFIMVKPLRTGRHTLVEHSTDIAGTDVTLSHELTIRRPKSHARRLPMRTRV